MNSNLPRFTRFVVPMALFLLVVTACEQDEPLTLQTDNETLSYNGPDPTTTLTGQFVEQLADAMQYSEVRSFVKEKVMLQFDGDYDFLLAFEKDSEISIPGRDDVRVFGDLFSYKSDRGFGLKFTSSTFVNDLLEENPLIQVHVPELWEGSTINWDESTHTPQIANLQLVEVDKGDLPTYLIATEEWTTISGTEAPKEVTIVVSTNERIVYSNGPYQYDSKRGSGVSQKAYCPLEPIDANGDDYYYNSQDVDDFDDCYLGDNPPPGGGGSNPKPGPINKSFPCGDSDRASNDNDDRVSFRRFKNIARWRDANEWFDGEHEMQVLITFRNTSGGPTTVRKSWFGSSDDLRTCRWFSCDVDDFNGEFKDVKTWLEDVQGDVMNYTWLEVDGGNGITLSIKFAPTIKIGPVEVKLTEVSASTTISNKSDRLGEYLVEYCDSTTPRSEYDTDWIIFHVNQRP